MDWIHCNNCGARPNQVKMMLTVCGHVFCRNCTARAKDAQCYLCKKPLKGDEINKNMRPELMELFKDARQVAAELMNELKQMITFQAKQREIFMKFKSVEIKRETDAFNEMRLKQQAAIQDIEKRKIAFAEDTERLKKARERKRHLTEKLIKLREEASHRQNPASCRSRTEPAGPKTARFRPPPNISRRGSHEHPLVGFLDQSNSKIVTSTPIANMEFSRREYRNRMFAAGHEHPSPIPRI
ncbi:unnamed protein product [Caenorhabditis sp. 36 PRJEB53466]|nr:unnamed protein product [Caenorhabditis sp. 36 PRJEB53466]